MRTVRIKNLERRGDRLVDLRQVGNGGKCDEI